MNNKILISVVIPSYNRANTVGYTIDSIIAQKVNADIEIVIGDDCSTDNAREVLSQYKEKYPDIIRLFFWEENLGLGANWASCVKECRGKYICNCDNDDYWHNPDKLQLQLDYMEAHPDCNVLITNHRCHNRDTGVITEEVAFINRKLPLQEAMWSSCRFCNATIMYRSEFLSSHVNLDDFITRRFSLQDWPVWVILSAYTDFEILPVSTATFGIETVSITRPDSYEKLEKRLKEDAKVSKYLGELFPEKFTQSDDGGKWINMQLMAMAFRKEDYIAAKKYAKLSQSSSLKAKFAQNRILFLMYVYSKKLKNAVKNKINHLGFV